MSALILCRIKNILNFGIDIVILTINALYLLYKKYIEYCIILVISKLWGLK